jgi:hypothetical protein
MLHFHTFARDKGQGHPVTRLMELIVTLMIILSTSSCTTT